MLAATPGATTAVVVRNTLARGAGAGFAAAAGAATGNTIQATVAAIGVAMVLNRWPLAANVVRAGGAAFLLWLGLRSLWRAAAPGAGVRKEQREGGGAAAGFRQGLMVNVLNPAITSFYVAVVPSFVPAGAGSGHYGALAGAHVAIAFACHACWTLAFDRLRHHADRPAVARGLEAAAGVILVALAIRVMASA